MKKRNQLIKREIRNQFRKLYWKLAFVKLHNENRRKRIDDEILKRIEVLEQKAHVFRTEKPFEFDLPKNEVPFVEVSPNELQPGKMYIICEENSDNICILRFRNLVTLPKELSIQAQFENDKGAVSSFSTYYHKFYQYTSTK